MTRRFVPVLMLSFVLVLPAGAADRDDDYRLVTDRFQVSIGGYLPDFATSASASVGVVFGPIIRFEKDLGLESRKRTVRVDGLWRIKGKHGLAFTWLAINRSSEGFLGPFEWDGTTYEGFVETKFDQAIYKLNYQHSFVNDGRTDAGFAVGLSTYEFDIGIRGDATVNGVPSGFEEFGTQLIAPIPSFGFYVTRGLTRKLILDLRADFFDVEIGDHSAELLDMRFTLDWIFIKHFGVGIGVNSIDIQYIQDQGSDKGLRIGYKQTGLMLYLKGAF